MNANGVLGSMCGAVHPVVDPAHLGRRADGRRGPAAGGARFHAVTFSENPEKLGYPSYHSDHWDPFWEACSETGTVVCLHIGSSSQLTITSVEAPSLR